MASRSLLAHALTWGTDSAGLRRSVCGAKAPWQWCRSRHRCTALQAPDTWRSGGGTAATAAAWPHTPSCARARASLGCWQSPHPHHKLHISMHTTSARLITMRRHRARPVRITRDASELLCSSQAKTAAPCIKAAWTDTAEGHPGAHTLLATGGRNAGHARAHASTHGGRPRVAMPLYPAHATSY